MGVSTLKSVPLHRTNSNGGGEGERDRNASYWIVCGSECPLYLNKRRLPYIAPHFLLKSQLQPGLGVHTCKPALRGRGRTSRSVRPAWATWRDPVPNKQRWTIKWRWKKRRKGKDRREGARKNGEWRRTRRGMERCSKS